MPMPFSLEQISLSSFTILFTVRQGASEFLSLGDQVEAERVQSESAGRVCQR